ncbi:histone acetyltransferase 1, partial [Coemansia spiralis]
AFDDMRDRSDMRMLAAHNAFDALGGGTADAATLQALQARFKLSRRQTRRCVEMALLRKTDGRKQDDVRQFRLFVKRRIYAQNADSLQGLDEDEKRTKIGESYAAVVDDYRRILSLL